RISERTCAVVLEPVQGEGGVIPATAEYLQAVRELCDRHDALLIFDEVQSGMRRTGKLFAYMHSGGAPDLMHSAQGISGSVPIAAMLTTDRVAPALSVGTHGSTYGGNPLGCAVAERVLDIINTPQLLDGVNERSAQLVAGLRTLNDELGVFSTVRGQGLLIGAVLSARYQGKAGQIMRLAQSEGVLVLQAGPDVVRLAPSLIIPEADIRDALGRLRSALLKLAE